MIWIELRDGLLIQGLITNTPYPPLLDSSFTTVASAISTLIRSGICSGGLLALGIEKHLYQVFRPYIGLFTRKRAMRDAQVMSIWIAWLNREGHQHLCEE